MAEYLKATKDELSDLIYGESKNERIDELWETAKEWGLIEEGSQTPYMEFAKMYLAYRRSMKHRGVTLIKPGTNQWRNLIDVCDEAMAFGKENGLEQRTGFKLFLDVASKITNSMKLHEIKAKADNIHEHFVAVAICGDDKNPKLSAQIYEAWEKRHLEATGTFSSSSEPLQYQYFVEAAELCREWKWRPHEFVAMIWNEFAWLGNPKPFHMVGDKAKEMLARGHDAKYGKKKIKRVSLKHITQRRDDSDRD